MGQFLPPWEGKGSPLEEKYPLVLMTPHMRFSYHTHFDNKSPWLDEIRPTVSLRMVTHTGLSVCIKLTPKPAESKTAT